MPAWVEDVVFEPRFLALGCMAIAEASSRMMVGHESSLER